MTQDPQNPITPIGWFSRFLGRLLMEITPKVGWGEITPAVKTEIIKLLQGNKLRINAIFERIRAGTYKPRKPTETPRKPPEPSEPPKPKGPRPPGPVEKKFGWLRPYLMPNYYAAPAQFRDLLREPEIVAMLEAAPAALGRPVRSLCWAFGIKPPPAVAPPKRPRKPPPETPKPAPEPPLEWDWNGRLTPEIRAKLPHADPLIYRMKLKGVRRPKGTRRGPPKTA
jgi:hypothetical protein